MKKTKLFFASLLIVILFTAGCVPTDLDNERDYSDRNKTDDWAYDPEQYDYEVGGIPLPSPTNIVAKDMMAAEDSIGFAVGGAMDINNFRENVESGYLPIPSDITYEGLFYDYFFDTGKTEECEKLFCPSYSYAISKDPFSQEEDYYLSVGLNSGIKESDFERKKLNLVVVLDISGSMDSPFDEYYYDDINAPFVEGQMIDPDYGKTKMEIANESIVGLLNHLDDDDRFGMVLFDDTGYLAKPVSDIGGIRMDDLKNHILEIESKGGTNMESGMALGTTLLEEYKDSDQSEYENRIIFLTDAMPNIGTIDDEGLFGMLNDNADSKIYTTFIGIGVDFNTELTEAITKVRGANYYSVHSLQEFKTRMDDEFEYMVTPLVFNLELVLEADGYNIQKVYGSPEADEATGEIMKVNTLFPSKTEGGATKGGLVLLKLERTDSDATLELSTSYEDRNGKVDSDIKEIEMGTDDPDYFDNDGIRKGILLARYADLVKNWLIEENELYEEDDDTVRPFVNYDYGIICPPPYFYELNEWERQSNDLSVSDHYEGLFAEFAEYYEEEMDSIGDESLSKELDVLNQLTNY